MEEYKGFFNSKGERIKDFEYYLEKHKTQNYKHEEDKKDLEEVIIECYALNFYNEEDKSYIKVTILSDENNIAYLKKEVARNVSFEKMRKSHEDKDVKVLVDYKPKERNFIFFHLFSLTVLIFGFANYNPNSQNIRSIFIPILSVAPLLISILLEREKRRVKFINNLILLGKRAYLDTNFDTYKKSNVISATSSLIRCITKAGHLEKYSWEKSDNFHGYSRGDIEIFTIVENVGQKHIDALLLEYPNFNIKLFENYKEKVDDYKDKAKRRFELESLEQSSLELESKITGISTEEILYNRDREQRREEEKESNKNDKGFQIATGMCPFCFKSVPRLARKCPHCTADL